jgi:hypothetical protein
MCGRNPIGAGKKLNPSVPEAIIHTEKCREVKQFLRDFQIRGVILVMPGHFG